MIRTLAVKVIEGLHSQSWEVIGRGGTWAGAMRPLEIYIQSKVERAVKAERQACAEMQRRATAYDGLVAQRDALLEKINGVLAAQRSEGGGCGGFINKPPTREHQRRVAQAWQELHEVIKAVEEGK